jgi:hypothetical protein
MKNLRKRVVGVTSDYTSMRFSFAFFAVNECYREWLLKNSLTRKWPKKLSNRKPYNRRSLFW